MDDTNDILSGGSGDSSDAGTPAASTPLSGGSDASTASPVPSMAPPDVSAGGPGPTPAVIPQSAPSPAAPAAPRPGIWQQVLAGALSGLAGARGATHFGGGLAGGAAGYLEQKQQQFQNQQSSQAQQAQLQFESVRAADSHIAALKSARAADTADEEAQDAIGEQHLVMAQTLKALGIEPTQTISSDNNKDMHAQATGGLTTLAQRNGGTIPAVVTTNSPAGANDDGKHAINVYAPNQTDIKKNATGYKSLVDAVSMVQNGSPVPDSAWTSGGGAMLGKIPNPVGGQQQMVLEAMKFLTIPPVPEGDKDGTKASAIQANLDQQLATAQKNPSIPPDVIKALQAKTDGFKAAVASSQKQANDTEAANVNALSGPQAAAAGAKTTAEENAKAATPLGRADLAQKQAEAGKAGIEFQEAKRDAANLTQPDSTGFTSPLGPKEYDKRYDAFSKSKDFQTLSTLKGSYEQFQDTVNKIAKTGDMNGAESVVGLFNAIGISATPLAGKGFRINSNTIEEHANARGIDQAAYQKLLSLKNGDVITPKQLTDYSNIASTVYHNSFVNLADEAHRQGLPVDFLPKGGGQPLDPTTARIFVDVTKHANPQLQGPALKSAVQKTVDANGWKVQ